MKTRDSAPGMDVFQQMLSMWSAWVLPLGFAAFAFRTLQRFLNLPSIHKYWERYEDYLTLSWTLTVNEYDKKKKWSGENEAYQALSWWLSTRAVLRKMNCDAFMPMNGGDGCVSIGPSERVYVREGDFSVRKIVRLSHMEKRFSYSQGMQNTPVEDRKFEIVYPNRRRVDVKAFLEKIASDYLVHKALTRTMHLYTLTAGRWPRKGGWQKAEFHHPMTINDLKMTHAQKDKLCTALDSFRDAEDWYRKNGTVWKTGFFLTGPPGTGKTSTAVAIANYLHYDIYLLSLAHVQNDISLMELNGDMGRRCVVLLEDADCFEVLRRRDESPKKTKEDLEKEKEEKQKKVLTLSGVLNFLDGVLSTVSKGRVFVMTTNRPEVIDPAVYRSGRLDHHFHMESCTFDQCHQMFDSYTTAAGQPAGVKRMLDSVADKVKDKITANVLTTSDMKSIILKHQWKSVGDETADVAECERAARAAIMELLAFEGTGDIAMEGERKDSASKKEKRRGLSARESEWMREIISGRLRSKVEENWIEELFSGNCSSFCPSPEGVEGKGLGASIVGDGDSHGRGKKSLETGVEDDGITEKDGASELGGKGSGGVVCKVEGGEISEKGEEGERAIRGGGEEKEDVVVLQVAGESASAKLEEGESEGTTSKRDAGA